MVIIRAAPVRPRQQAADAPRPLQGSAHVQPPRVRHHRCVAAVPLLQYQHPVVHVPHLVRQRVHPVRPLAAKIPPDPPPPKPVVHILRPQQIRDRDARQLVRAVVPVRLQPVIHQIPVCVVPQRGGDRQHRQRMVRQRPVQHRRELVQPVHDRHPVRGRVRQISVHSRRLPVDRQARRRAAQTPRHRQQVGVSRDVYQLIRPVRRERLHQRVVRPLEQVSGRVILTHVR